jgi:hypothetical protein
MAFTSETDYDPFGDKAGVVCMSVIFKERQTSGERPRTHVTHHTNINPLSDSNPIRFGFAIRLVSSISLELKLNHFSVTTPTREESGNSDKRTILGCYGRICARLPIETDTRISGVDYTGHFKRKFLAF